MAARSKKVDPLKAKEAKQKKIAIGGMVLLCALGAIQGPKTLKMLQGPQPVAAPATTSTTPAAPAPAPAGGAPVDPAAPAPAPGAAPAPAPELAAVADSDPAPAPAEGDLVTFELFESKDPFAPQVTAKPPAPPAPAEGEAKDGGKKDGEKPADGGFTPAPADGSGGGTPGGSPTPTAPAVAAATSISVNGTPEDVAVDGQFPAEEPTFVLVALGEDGKSVEIGVAGGNYANGEDTITLELGEPLTLQNTADGSRYELELLTVLGFPLPKP